jgi:tRNA pseudouridine38-40 synthase
LERALTSVLEHPVRALGSSRTDAGVHAVAQAAVIRTDRWPAPADRLPFAVNTRLPSTVVVRCAREVPIEFHPLRDCIGKRYQYQIYNSRKADPIGGRIHWWVRRRISLERMQAATEMLTGTRDFASFESAGSPRSSTIRTIRQLSVVASEHLDGQMLTVSIEADGFLYNMVRNIVGTLVQVGVGREDPQWISQVLGARDRRLAGATAPAQGLTLMQVSFAQRVLVEPAEECE